jgi:hypothetical protein
MKNQDKKLDTNSPDAAPAPFGNPVSAGPIPVPIPGGDALTDPSMATFAPADSATGAGLGDLLKEGFVRGSISDEENALTRDQHVGHHPITGRLDEAVDAPDHNVTREDAVLPGRGR